MIVEAGQPGRVTLSIQAGFVCPLRYWIHDHFSACQIRHPRQRHIALDLCSNLLWHVDGIEGPRRLLLADLPEVREWSTVTDRSRWPRRVQPQVGRHLRERLDWVTSTPCCDLPTAASSDSRLWG